MTIPRDPRRLLTRTLTARACAAVCAAAVAGPATQRAVAQVPEVCPAGEQGCALAVLSGLDAWARAALVAGGGSPLPGSASTLGKRTAASRHVAIATRVTVGEVLGVRGATSQVAPSVDGTLVAVGVDAAVALFDGFFAAPTVGGVFSIDALASVGWIGGGGSLDVSDGMTWALGARLGVLRESFTLPGLTVSAAYRQIARFEAASAGDGPGWQGDLDGLSVRLTAGKRLGSVDALVGAGWDRVGGPLSASYTNLAGAPEVSAVADVDVGRWAGFAGVGWTFLVFQVAAEAGWQAGGDGFSDSGVDIEPSGGRAFGGISFRFTY
ncbi:MAG: hypothetical protein ABFS34_08455 [Gemmatimonadota bacterium]